MSRRLLSIIMPIACIVLLNACASWFGSKDVDTSPEAKAATRVNANEDLLFRDGENDHSSCKQSSATVVVPAHS